jgi:hypothetical protein
VSYVYIRSEPGLYTVGFYKPNGRWEPESDFTDREEAAKRVAWLNGSRVDEPLELLDLDTLEERDE